MPGLHQVPMGGNKADFTTDRCPWSLVFNDRDARHFLAAYGVIEKWREFPPGPRDPRLMEAISVIAAEHDTVTREMLPK